MDLASGIETDLPDAHIQEKVGIKKCLYIVQLQLLAPSTGAEPSSTGASSVS